MLAELPALPAERGDEFLGQPRKQFDARCGNVQNLVLARRRALDKGLRAPELGGEQIDEHITMTSTKLGTNITATLADLSATSLWTITKMGTAAAHKLPVTAGRREHGKMTIKNLQNRSGGEALRYLRDISPPAFCS